MGDTLFCAITQPPPPRGWVFWYIGGMRIVVAQPALMRYQWELDVLLTNIRSLDKETTVTLLFLEGEDSVLEHFENSHYGNLEIYCFPDNRPPSPYGATAKPYLMWRYLEHTGPQDILYIDSDIIFREMPDFSKFKGRGKVAYGGDCEGYLGFDYLNTRDNAQEVLASLSRATEVPVSEIPQIPGAGAQWFIKMASSALFESVFWDSIAIYQAIEPISTNLQKWTAEMWATSFALYKHGWSIKISDELTHCWPTDSTPMWGMRKILHNSGVVGVSAAGLFYKGQYSTTTPFNDDLSWVRKDKCSRFYVDAIRQVV